MGGRAHVAVLTRVVDGCGGALLGREVCGCPAGDLKLWMPRVVAALHAVAILEKNAAVRIDQKRTEGLIVVFERLTCELDAATQVAQVCGGECGAIGHALTVAVGLDGTSRRSELRCC